MQRYAPGSIRRSAQGIVGALLGLTATFVAAQPSLQPSVQAGSEAPGSVAALQDFLAAVEAATARRPKPTTSKASWSAPARSSRRSGRT